MSRCNSCGAYVRWVTLVRKDGVAKPHPVNLEPTDNGSIRVTESGGASIVPQAERGGLLLYVSHFATCPQAAQHRRATR